MNGSGLVCHEQRPLGYQATFQLQYSLTKHGGSAWRTKFFPLTCGNMIGKLKIDPELEEHSLTGDSNKDSWGGGSSYGDPRAQRLHKGQLGRIQTC
jgi:hypothetical protein